MDIEDTELLHKIIEFQSCIIEGRSLKALLHVNNDFFLEKSGADIIVIYMHEHEKVNPEYILQRDKLFSHLLQKYVLNKNNFKWNLLVQNCDNHFSSGLKYDKITDLYEIFKGFISKKNANTFTDQLEMKNAVMMPLYDFKNKTKLGYICYIFQTDRNAEIEKIQIVQNALQTLLRPLYDKAKNSVYNNYIRIDEQMKLLTSQEKKIVKRVLKGNSYPEIAASLSISINTLKTHMKNIFNKYNVNSKIELYNKLNTYK